MKIMNIKLSTVVVAAAAALLATPLAHAQVTLTDIGAAAPTPGAYDQSQISAPGYAAGSLTYWLQYNGNMGQIFTTGNNAGGYVMTSLAIGTDGSGVKYGTTNYKYDLDIFSINPAGTLGIMVTNFIVTSGIGTNNDWVQWGGLNVSLAPNTKYAYVFTVDNANQYTVQEKLSCAGGTPYAGGQICQLAIPQNNGFGYGLGVPINYDSTGGPSDGTVSAAFDVGLIPATNAVANPPTCTNAAPIYAGTTVTLTETAQGAGTLTYQWITDSGSGGANWTPLGTSPTQAVNTTGFTPGIYQYEVSVNNGGTPSVSPVLYLSIVSSNQVGLSDIGYFPPTPGTNDQYMTNGPGWGGSAGNLQVL